MSVVEDMKPEAVVAIITDNKADLIPIQEISVPVFPVIQLAGAELEDVIQLSII